MSANSGDVPDAWEDSWENQVDVCDSVQLTSTRLLRFTTRNPELTY
jgi:hypothetical protein